MLDMSSKRRLAQCEESNEEEDKGGLCPAAALVSSVVSSGFCALAPIVFLLAVVALLKQ